MEWQIGDRVELVQCNDEFTKLAPGELGTVSFIDDMGTVFVDWDGGSKLGMIPGEDIIKRADGKEME